MSNDWLFVTAMLGFSAAVGSLVGPYYQVPASLSIVLAAGFAIVFVLVLISSKDDEATA